MGGLLTTLFYFVGVYNAIKFGAFAIGVYDEFDGNKVLIKEFVNNNAGEFFIPLFLIVASWLFILFL